MVISTFGANYFAYERDTTWRFTNTSNPFLSISFVGSDPPLNVSAWFMSGQVNIFIPSGVIFQGGRSSHYAIPGVPEPLSIVPFGLAGLSLNGVARRRLRSRASTRF